MLATKNEIPFDAFNFSGQTDLDTWKLRNLFEEKGWSTYNKWLVDELPFCFQQIRELADSFPFWQRRKGTGRPPTSERTLLIAFMVRQFFHSTFRRTEGLLRLFSDIFRIDSIPDYSVMSRKNSSKRWNNIWKRFHRFVLARFPERKSIVATDGSGFSGRKRSWRETPYAQRANEDWVKVHAAVEIDSFLILNLELTESNVHESRMFGKVWDDLPDNITPVRSLADSAYTSDECIRIANEHGAKAFHDVKSNAVHFRFPKTAYQKLVNFATHWPNRFKSIKAKRAHVETAFGMVGERFGHRLRCRTDEGRKNEVYSKFVAHNIMLMATSCFMIQG